MSNSTDEKPPETKPEDDDVKPTNEEISDKLLDALKGDESLTDDDRRSIAEGLTTKTGGTIPEPVKPASDHWTGRKLW